MGVVVLQQFPCPEGRSGPQTIDMLLKRIMTLGVVPAGTFCVDLDTYTPNPAMSPPPSRQVFVMHDTEQPASVFSILDTGAKTICLITDSLFDNLMQKMSALYTNKKVPKIESKGQRLELANGDFLVKLGSVTTGQSFKGILVEVEYLPCVIPASCWELIRELMQSFLGSCVPQAPPQYLQNRMNDIYEPKDTMYQYLEHFAQLRRR